MAPRKKVEAPEAKDPKSDLAVLLAAGDRSTFRVVTGRIAELGGVVVAIEGDRLVVDPGPSPEAFAAEIGAEPGVKEVR